MPQAPVDPQALAALNTRYAQRFAALWSALQAASIATAPTAAIQGDRPRVPEIVAPAAGDRRFAAPEWDDLPYFALMKQSYLLASEYAQEVAALTPLPESDRSRVEFMTRQVLDAAAPTNFLATNPEAIKRALETNGASLARGFTNLVADTLKGHISLTDERAFAVGENLAITPGAVVYRNELIELIQYAPTTAKVHRHPLLIVPPCINKYYILDLQPENSFVRYAVAQGHTVFMVSWRNIPAELGHLRWDDYIEEGVIAALRIAGGIAGTASVNALGFCVGGTLLTCALAVLAARGEQCARSVTLLTTLLDFADPGPIGVYVSRDLLALREASLLAGQRMRGGEIAGAFASLRANDLVWHYVVGNYLKGETPPAFDLLYWNGDSSNLPGPMYVYYLRAFYLDNRLTVPGALTMAGTPVDLRQVNLPAYVFAARDDHIVPWRSAYRANALLGRRPTFVLGASGHVAGVINPPSKKQRHYWLNDTESDDAEQWLAGGERHPGSWWPHWSAWLARHAGARIAAPFMPGNAAHPPLDAAPGRYVRQSAR